MFRLVRLRCPLLTSAVCLAALSTSVAGSQALVLCHDGRGHIEVEPAWSTCCSAGPAGATCWKAADGCAEPAHEDDGCTDVGLDSPATVCSQRHTPDVVAAPIPYCGGDSHPAAHSPSRVAAECAPGRTASQLAAMLQAAVLRI